MEEDKKAFDRLQEMVEKLQQKIRVQKRQIEEAVSFLSLFPLSSFLGGGCHAKLVQVPPNTVSFGERGRARRGRRKQPGPHAWWKTSPISPLSPISREFRVCNLRLRAVPQCLPFTLTMR